MCLAKQREKEEEKEQGRRRWHGAFEGIQCNNIVSSSFEREMEKGSRGKV